MVICQAAIQRVVDGDTLDAVARIWPGTLRECRVRLLARGQTAVDAWEMRGHDKELGQLAHAFVKQELAGCAWVALLVNDKTDNFGRELAAVYYMPHCTTLWDVLMSGIDLGTRLIDKGHAVPYVRGVADDGIIQPVPAGWKEMRNA